MAFRTVSAPVRRSSLTSSFSSIYASSVVDFVSSTKSPTVRRVKPARSELFVKGTTFGHNETKRRSGSGSVSVPGLWRYDGPYSYWINCYSVDDVGSIDLTFNALDGRLRARIKDSNLNLAQSVAEYRQACSMFANAASTIYRTFRSLRRGAPLADIVRYLQNDRRNVPGDIANRWLEYQYGFKPLLSDVYGAAEELTKSLTGEYFRFVKTSSTENYFGSSRRNCVLDSVTLFPYNTHTKKVVTKTVRARYRISIAGLKQLSQIGITNPALLAWELIPYSFVVDWMFPVGDFLSSLDALNGVSDLAVQRSYRVVKTTTAGRWDIREDQTNFQRLAVTDGLSLPKIGYQPSSSLNAVLNGMALLTQLRSR